MKTREVRYVVSTMTKKDYELIAHAIDFVLNEEKGERETLFSVMSRLAQGLKNDNDKFDAVRFMGACGFNIACTNHDGPLLQHELSKFCFKCGHSLLNN